MPQIEKHPKIATVILAAGESKRMNTVKQLLLWKNSTLLEYTIKQSILSQTRDVFVVLGAHKNKILNTIDAKEITIIDNPNWPMGMGSSIISALDYFHKFKMEYDAIFIVLIDQPLLNVTYYNKLINKYIEGFKIITSSYKKGFGVPAIFDKTYFDKLMDLHAGQGAKKIINEHLDDMVVVDSGNKTIDLDTKADYLKYYNQYGQ